MNQKEYQKKWQEENKEKLKEYRKNNASKIRAYQIKYYSTHKKDYVKREKKNRENRKGREHKYKNEPAFNNQYREKYGMSWNSVKLWGINALEAVQKAGRKCEICHQEKDKLCIHHKDNQGWAYNKKGLEPNNSTENIMILCNGCHTRLHKQKNGL